MRMIGFTLITVSLMYFAGGTTGLAGGKDKGGLRYGVDLNTKAFPQDSPKAALQSVTKALGEGRVDYLLAHLADPEFTDTRVAKYGERFKGDLKPEAKDLAAFDLLVKEITTNYREDPAKLKELMR